MSIATQQSPTGPDYTAIKERQQQTWASGDYQVLAALIVQISERLCDTVGLRAGERVLDVASGTGNTAIAAARRLCEVTGMDYAPTLLERGRARAAIEELPVTFTEGDTENLPVPDGSYDVVLSTVGSMFSPDQEQAARELLRVCRPSGRIGLANWTPDGFVGEMLRIVGRRVPPPAGLRPATRWGTEVGMRELFGDEVAALEMNRRDFVFHFVTAQQFLDLFRTYYGPVHKAFAALDEAGQEALARDLVDAVERFNQADEGTLAVPAEYLEVVAIRA
jgi:ubiquinone/menaquinone biosynthesis C-methylase UbiE